MEQKVSLEKHRKELKKQLSGKLSSDLLHTQMVLQDVSLREYKFLHLNDFRKYQLFHQALRP